MWELLYFDNIKVMYYYMYSYVYALRILNILSIFEELS